MSMIREGSEWQARAMADAARELSEDEFEPMGDDVSVAYLSGVRDALLFLSGSTQPREAPFSAMYQRYLDSI